MRRAVRDFTDKIGSGDVPAASDALKLAYQQIDKVTAKGTIHKNTAARQKSRLAKMLDNAK